MANPCFRPPHQIRPELKKLEGDARYWLEHGIYPPSEVAARFHEKLETIHPFANGNGRFGRILTEYVCKQRFNPVPSWGDPLHADPASRRRVYIDALNHAWETRSYVPLMDFMFS